MKEYSWCPKCEKSIDFDTKEHKINCPFCNIKLIICTESFSDGEGGSVMGFILEPDEDN